jgi:hypothetical protein
VNNGYKRIDVKNSRSVRDANGISAVGYNYSNIISSCCLDHISEIDELKGSVDNLLGEVKEIKKLIPSSKIADTHASKIAE